MAKRRHDEVSYELPPPYHFHVLLLLPCTSHYVGIIGASKPNKKTVFILPYGRNEGYRYHGTQHSLGATSGLTAAINHYHHCSTKRAGKEEEEFEEDRHKKKEALRCELNRLRGRQLGIWSPCQA